MAVLQELVQRAAVMRLPFSPHDAILLVRALKHLHQHGAAVKRINEKAAFAVAAASPPVDAAVVVDVVHHLAAMQSSSLPIVHQVLLRRVLELHPQHTPPQTAHKSAVTIIKIGFRHRHEEASMHVLRLLHEAMLREEMAMDAADESLRLAFVGLYPYTKLGEGEVLRRECVAPSSSSRRASSQRLLMCAEWLTRGSSSSPPPMASMRGSRALQALHLAVPLAACTSATPHDDDDDGQRRWSAVLRSFCSHLCLDHIRGSSCTRFIYDFMPQLVRQRRVAAVFLERLAHVPWMCKLGPQDLYRLAASMGQYCDRSAPTAQGWRGSSTQIDDGLKHVVELLQGCVGRLCEVMEQPPAHMPTSSSAITHEEYSLALASMWRWAAQLIHGLHEDHLAHHRAHLRPAIDDLRRCTAAALRQGRCSNDHVPWMVVSICRIAHRGMLSSVKDVRENDDDDVAQLVKCIQSKPRTHRGVIQLIYAITLLGQEEHGQRWIQRLHQRHGIDLRECVRQWCAELGGIEAATQVADAMMLLHSILNWETFFDAATTTTTSSSSSESSSSPPPALMHAALSAAVAVPSFDETSALIVVEAVACAMHFTTDIHQLEMLASILATAERSISRGLPFNHMLRIAAQVARVPRSRIHHHPSMELAHQRIVALICTSSAHLRRKPPRKRHRFLAVAEALLHHGVKLVVHPCATHNNGSNTNDDAHADDVFVVDVEWLMRGDGDDAMSERDAAHLLRLLSQAVLLHNHDVVAHLSSDLLHSLMQRAFRASNDANMPWRCVLLLNANDHLNASMALFSNEQLHQICDLTLQTVRDLLPSSSSSTATHDDDDDDDGANTKLIRQLVVALVQSQIPVRLASVDTWANAAEASTLSAVADWLRERSSSTSHTSSGGDDMASLAFRLQIIFGLPPPS